MKIVTIVGARPQFVKAAMLSRAIMEYNTSHTQPIEEQLLHTGQHYDDNMSRLFFDQMHIPKPTWQLHCGNCSEAEMTGKILVGTEEILKKVQPDCTVVFGDTDSTLAGALAAVKLHIPVVHIEAGLRSFNREMPEEINRVMTDHISTILFCPTSAAVANLTKEGITKGVYQTGDVMYDAALLFGRIAEKESRIMQTLSLTDRAFRLCTIHRASNTDSADTLQQIVAAFLQLATPDCPLVWPLHPRTRKVLTAAGLLNRLQGNPLIRLTEPLGYLDMTALEQHALQIVTDSGGVQKEAYFHRTPCITLRNETEWVETVQAGWNRLAGTQTEEIVRCCLSAPSHREEIREYGNGHAAADILQTICHAF